MKRILIAWQGFARGPQGGARQLAVPGQGDEILLTQVRDHGEMEPAKTSVHDVAKYLSRHRIGASAGIMLKATGSVADELILVAELEKIDLIVAGAYGHSRRGVWVFGGVTLDILARSPVCCLFSH